jgi:TonB-linked SusC/RagA family outer membrane protein
MKTVLNFGYKPMRKILPIIMLLLIISVEALAQQTITGRVTDANTRETLPSATVRILGTTTGTVTDMDGNYSIMTISADDILEFSYVGYTTQKVKPGSNKVVNIALTQDAKTIEGIIITAIGIKAEKKSLGYAAQEVGGSELGNSKTGNIVNALSSKVAGLEVISSAGTPGASASITIRGRSSLRASGNSPLFVVDGVPIDNSYDGSYVYDYSNRAIDLNSDDIESVSVLKGAAAAALYGIRAANGAILVTTKSGKSKGGASKSISFKTSVGFDQVNKLPERQSMYSQGTGGKYSSTSNASWGALIDTLRYDGSTNDLKDRNGRIVGMSDPAATDMRVNAYPVDNFFQTAMTSNTYLSMSGNNENGSYIFSLGHLDQSGIVPFSHFWRTNVKIAGDSKLSNKLKISGSANYSNSLNNLTQKGSNLSAVMVGLMRNTPTFDLTNGSDDPENDPSAYMYPDGTQRNYYSQYDNPYWSINRNKARAEVNRIIGNTQVDYDLFPWLKAMYRVGIDHYGEKRNSFFDNNSSDTPNGYVTANTYFFTGINSDLLLSAEKQLTEDLKLNVTAGHNYYVKETYFNYQRGDSLILPNFYDLSNTAVTSGDDSKSAYKIAGAYYDVKLSYKGVLYFNTTGRNDWSSTLAKGNNSFFYPSFNTSFIFSEALSLDRGKVFSYGKVRASWAEVGNDADPYSLRNYFAAITGGINGQTAFATERTIGNENLKPETTRSSEFGFDLRFFNNKIGLDFAVYQAKSIGQIVPVPVAYSTGYEFMVLNAGVITNKGIEAQLFITPIARKGFNWDMMFNFTKNRNMVESLPDGVPLLDFQTTGVSSTRSVAIAGQPYGVLYGSRYLRNEDGDIMVGDNGYPLVDVTAGVIGDPNPDFMLGFRNTFNYKGIQLSLLFDIRQGGVVYNGTKNVMTSLGTSKNTENRDEDFIFPGKNINTGLPNDVVVKRDARYYSAQGGLAGLSEAAIEDGSFVRLRELSLSYNLPVKWLGKTPFRSVNLGINSRNLLLWTKYSGIDPETNLSGVSNSLGRDYFNMPNTKSVEFSLQLSL